MKYLIQIRLLIFALVIPISNYSQNINGFAPGEEIEFIIKYGPIVGGRAIATLENARINNQEVYHAKMVARSAGLADLLYRVEDIYESYFSPETGLPYMAIRNISEGDYRFYNETEFFHKDNYVLSQKSGKIDVPEGILDMVTALYKIRRLNYSNYKDGDIINITTYFDDEIFPFDIRYKGIETIKTSLGNVECIKFVPFVEPGRIFESEDDMTIWVSNDKNLLPIRVKFDLLVGSIKCDLVNYSNLKYPSNILD